MPVKRCPKCGEEKELTSEFWSFCKNRKGGGSHSWCKVCNATATMKRHLSPVAREQNKDYAKQRRFLHPEKIREIKRKCDNTGKGRERNRRQQQYWRDILDDIYIKARLKRIGIVSSSVTPELIELKRQQITMKRNLKQFKKWREERENESDHEYVSGEQRENEENYGGELQDRADNAGTARV